MTNKTKTQNPSFFIQQLQLPNEIIALIIHHLTKNHNDGYLQTYIYQCTLVSKQFYVIANAILWATLDFYTTSAIERFFTAISDMPADRSSTLGEHVRRISLGVSFYWIDQPALLRLLQAIPNLSHLTVTTNCIAEATFQQLNHHCIQLVSLELDCSALTQTSFTVMGQYYHQLDHLKWRISRLQSAEWLEYLVVGCCPLTHLDILARQPMSSRSKTIIQNMHQLTHLTIKQPSGGHTQTLLAFPSPPSRRPWWPQLKSLDLRYCKVDESTLIGFIQLHPHLQELSLSRVLELSDKCLNALTTVTTDLLSLSLKLRGQHSNLTFGGIQRFIIGCPHLMQFELNFCGKVLRQDFQDLLDDDSRYDGIKLSRWGIQQIRDQKQPHMGNRSRSALDS